MQTGACYFEAEDWQLAEMAFLKARMLFLDHEQRNDAAYLVAACLFNASRFRSCRRLIHNDLWRRSDGIARIGTEGIGDGKVAARRDTFPAAGLYPSSRILAPVLSGLCDMVEGNWNEACQAFQQGQISAGTGPYVRRLQVMSDRAEAGRDLPRRSKGFATALSILIPGSGQIYAGRTEDGLRHLIFNGALIYTVAKLVDDEHYPAAYLATTIGLPFYIGNIRGAHYSAAAFNRDRRLEFTTETIERAGDP
jgi:TM2 domain-containing membrane protein YozV